MNQWNAEREVSPEDVRTWLENAGRIVHEMPRLVGTGFDNFVFEVDGLYVRAARRQLAVPDIKGEVRLLPLLRHLSLPIPFPEFIPPGIEDMKWPFFAYRPVPGRELGDALLEHGKLPRVALRLGRFLAELHTPALAEKVRPIVREDKYRRTDIPHRLALAKDRVVEVEARFHVDLGNLQGIFADAADLPVMPATCLVHGDTHFRHVMVKGNEASGIIDWGDAHFGNPAVDLHVMWNFDESDRREFRSAYGAIPDDVERASRVVAVFINAVLALSAGDFALPNVESAALLALERLSANA
jgi:aminoglycoside phosphotransferase (APT) family kinase protein